jgi:hypothetical protein
MAKLTIKEQVLRYVESVGSARFTDIQKFVYDLRYGKGSYDAGYQLCETYVWSARESNYVLRTRRMNQNRGYFASAFDKWGGYFVYGANRLVKDTDGLYTVVRPTPKA